VVVLDVAHNPHAVAALAQSLDAMGSFLMTHGVFGAMADKDIAAILRHMDPLIDRWYFTDLPTPRAASAQALEATWRAVTQRAGAAAECFATPMAAFNAAAARVQPTDRIVCFGSFYTVGGVLEHGVPHLESDAPWQHADR
jgi:dihydrofolate synthase/folylpolyglutamate synthase